MLRTATVAALFVTPVMAADAPRPPVRSVAFSPDGTVLVVTTGAKDAPGAAVGYDAATRKPLWRRDGPGGFGSVSVAPDGKTVAVTHGKPTALRLDAAAGKTVGEVGPHPGEVRAVAHLPGTNLLAAGGDGDGTVRLWDLTTGAVAKELKGHPAEVRRLVPSPTGKWLVSQGADTTRVWDVAAGTELKGVLNQNRGIGHYGVVFVGPDRLMLAMNDGGQRVYDLAAGKVVLRFHSAGGYDRSAYSPAAGLAAFGGYGWAEPSVADLTFRPPTAAEQATIDRLLKEFDDDSYEAREKATAAMRVVGSVAEPALAKAAAGGSSAEVRMRAREVRKVILDEPLRKLAGHTGAVGPMAFSPDGTTLATGADDGTVRLWDPRTGKELGVLEPAKP